MSDKCVFCWADLPAAPNCKVGDRAEIVCERNRGKIVHIVSAVTPRMWRVVVLNGPALGQRDVPLWNGFSQDSCMRPLPPIAEDGAVDEAPDYRHATARMEDLPPVVQESGTITREAWDRLKPKMKP